MIVAMVTNRLAKTLNLAEHEQADMVDMDSGGLEQRAGNAADEDPQEGVTTGGSVADENGQPGAEVRETGMSEQARGAV